MTENIILKIAEKIVVEIYLKYIKQYYFILSEKKFLDKYNYLKIFKTILISLKKMKKKVDKSDK